MPDYAPKVTILSWVPEYGEVKYLIGDKKYMATGLSPFHYNKVKQFLGKTANGKAIQYLKQFKVEPIKESRMNMSKMANKITSEIMQVQPGFGTCNRKMHRRGPQDGTGPRRDMPACPNADVKQAAQFVDPKAITKFDGKLDERELVRAVRQAIAAEHEAVHLYEAIADASDGLVAKVMQDIADEEKVHVHELHAVLNKLSPDEKEFEKDAEDEIEEMESE